MWGRTARRAVGWGGSPQLVITNHANPTTVIGLLVPFGHCD
jgi:hypothetical protein